MNDPILVRGTMRTWDCTLLLVLGLLLLLGAALAVAFSEGVVAGLLVAAACVSALAGALIRYRRARRRRWVQDQGDGFLVSDSAGERRFRDDDILSMALLYKQNYHQGLPTSVTRRFLVWVAGSGPMPERIEMVNTPKPGAADPLNRLIHRIGDLLCQRAEDELANGQPVLGEGWTLHGDELTVRTGGTPQVCRLEDLAAVDVVDNAICIWRSGQDETFARVPRASANAYVLQRLLEDRRDERPAPATPPEGGLGRVIFERRSRRGTFTFLVVLACFLLFVTVMLLLAGLTVGPEPVLWGLGLGAGAVASFVGALQVRCARFRCHQYGVYKAGLLGERSLRYTDVASFSYSAVRHFHNGAYTGTRFHLGFEPIPGQGNNPIRHSVMLPHADQELDNLRDQVARMIAARMTQQLGTSERVPWTNSLTLLRDGIEYQPRGLFGRKEPLFIPFKDIQSYQIHKGTFYLWMRGRPKPVAQEAMTRANFFPGFYVLCSAVPLG
jgi:hypothetical protein